MAPDPLHEAEKIIERAHGAAGKYTEPVLKRYPLLFALLVTLSVVAILHSFELLVARVPLLYTHPIILMAAGVLGLLLTGRLYKKLGE